jgi:hypothetical protein
MIRARALQALMAALLLLLLAFAPGLHSLQHAFGGPSACAACCCGRQHLGTNANARRDPVVQSEVSPAGRCSLCDLLNTPLPMQPAPAVAVPSLPWPLCAIVRAPAAAAPSVASFDLYRVRAPPRSLLV